LLKNLSNTNEVKENASQKGQIELTNQEETIIKLPNSCNSRWD